MTSESGVVEESAVRRACTSHRRGPPQRCVPHGRPGLAPCSPPPSRLGASPTRAAWLPLALLPPGAGGARAPSRTHSGLRGTRSLGLALQITAAWLTKLRRVRTFAALRTGLRGLFKFLAQRFAHKVGPQSFRLEHPLGAEDAPPGMRPQSTVFGRFLCVGFLFSSPRSRMVQNTEFTPQVTQGCCG